MVRDSAQSYRPSEGRRGLFYSENIPNKKCFSMKTCVPGSKLCPETGYSAEISLGLKFEVFTAVKMSMSFFWVIM
jgi:hypothetical protein